jgi:FlaA1/EpsC-like NDP-sugar epimerase
MHDVKIKMNRFASMILSLPRGFKRGFAVVIDLTLCILSVWLAFYLRIGFFPPISEALIFSSIVSVSIALPIFITSGLYRAIFRYNGLSAMIVLVRANLLYGIFFAAIFTFYGVDGVPRTIGLIQPILLMMLVAASRAGVRILVGSLYLQKLRQGNLPKALIYGAGDAGRQFASAMINSPEIRVVGFLDNDERLHGQTLNGFPIFNPTDLFEIINELNVTVVLLALPSVSNRRRFEIIESLKLYKIIVRTLPGLGDLASGKVSIEDVHDLDINDLLGREPIQPNNFLLSKNITNKIVLVTGAGGSIGSELCRQILVLAPKKLLLIEQSEFALYKIHQELEEKQILSKTALIPLIASVQDGSRIRQIMSTWNPDTVYHAAAYKHVPLVEHNPSEGIRNNVLGTLRTALSAIEYGVSDFVLISTDKAVRPTNIMGASKRIAEIILQALSDNSTKTKFSMVRFGNVLGSSGSVVPRFRKQIRNGGPITLTHPEITRYFMSIPEAAQLVIQAGAMANGGEVFVLDMGEPVKIIDLASRMISLAGLTIQDDQNTNGDIKIEITGLRPGEKLYEELLIGEKSEITVNPRIMKAHENFISWEVLRVKLESLEIALDSNNLVEILFITTEIVGNYKLNPQIVDWIYLEKSI